MIEVIIVSKDPVDIWGIYLFCRMSGMLIRVRKYISYNATTRSWMFECKREGIGVITVFLNSVGMHSVINEWQINGSSIMDIISVTVYIGQMEEYL